MFHVEPMDDSVVWVRPQVSPALVDPTRLAVLGFGVIAKCSGTRSANTNLRPGPTT